MPRVRKAHSRHWYEGPLFSYRATGIKSPLTVDVTRSSMGIGGLDLSQEVKRFCEWFAAERGSAEPRILDFGAGAWLRYTTLLATLFPRSEVHFVEYSAAFHGSAAQVLAQARKLGCHHWDPAPFAGREKPLFDLVLVINVLNSVPESSHREQIFSALAGRLAPLGNLVVYQRIWYASENPGGALDYGSDGWLIPQRQENVYTFRGGTTNTWFNELGDRPSLHLRKFPLPASGKPGNVIFKVWERRFQ